MLFQQPFTTCIYSGIPMDLVLRNIDLSLNEISILSFLQILLPMKKKVIN